MDALIAPLLQQDLDDWTRRVVARHFDPEGGSPYWLGRAAGLPFDPRDVTRYAELAEFGPFPLEDLRTIDPASLVPASGSAPLHGCVFDSGGTTGPPCRIFYTGKMLRQRGIWRHWSFRSEGFERGRVWLQATPAGPHIVGHGATELVGYGARVYAIDFDPRWVKRLVRQGRLAEADAYTAHLVGQIADLVGHRRIDYLSTTPALFRAFLRAEPDLAGSLRGIRVAGTQITPAMYVSFRAALLDGIVGRTYGNTLGVAAGLPAPPDGSVLPYIPNYPQITMTVTSKADWRRTVGYGAVGRVLLTVLHEDLFLPNVLERDQASRYDTGPDWPCDGVADVRPLQDTSGAPETLY
ncbi:long-chain fatty acid--CoA ligase [Amycolatopsis acidicola]|uniref:Long-chain fatty acid--CoA ligase n=1 Tax=Amycolatopsis acidicola TaxID=2596893 RepID=A0A5N0VK03_9PSEU|nr:long-chain fatty acid--CoA ligase [Amycolatopsis acidicola]KAA9166496.1 long-chain fatty acid--CoA ligase [Amycolatopsis acidicola]